MPRGAKRDGPTMEALVAIRTGRTDPITGRPLPRRLRRQSVALEDYIRWHAKPGPDGKPDPRAMAYGMAYVAEAEEVIERINRNNTRHAWQADLPCPPHGQLRVCPVDVRVRQLHVGVMFHGTQLCTFGPLGAHGLTREQRRTLRVGGEPTVELYYECMDLRMLYHMNREDPPGDLYRPRLIFPAYYALQNAHIGRRAILRSFVKQATAICWDARSRAHANGAVRRLLAAHAHSEFIGKVLANTEGIRPAAVIDRIMAAHPTLRPDFFTGIAPQLMTNDSAIMLHVLTEFAKREWPALGLHNAVVVAAGDAPFARALMRREYRRYLRYNPVIRRG